MKKHTKHITTQKIERLKRMEKLVWLIPPAMFVFMVLFVWGPFQIISLFEESFTTGVFTIIFAFITLAVSYIPLMMIWHAISHAKWKSAVKDTTFSVFQDFDYYRDELTGISPAVISMCTDLEIETEKDITAQLLSYSLRGIVDLSGDTVRVLRMDDPRLTLSDRYLLGMLVCGRLDSAVAQQWANIAKSEVVGGEFIKNKSQGFPFSQNATAQNSQQYVPGAPPPNTKPDTSGCGQLLGCSTGCLPIIIMGIAVVAFGSTTMFTQLSDFLDNAQYTAMSNEEAMQAFWQNPQMLLAMVITTILVLLTISAMVRPVALVIGAITGAKVSSPYERTKAGEVLTEEIYGLKNFIRDFSMLSDAQKEQLVLWDDFLVYAVVLEENDIVVREILQMRNINLYRVHI